MSKPRKILCMIDMLGSGGAQRQLVELAIGYKERGYEVAFLIYYKAFDNYYDKTLADAHISIMDVDEANYLLRIIKMRKQMKAFDPDVVIAFLEVPAFIAEMASILPHKWKLIVGERSAAPKKLKERRLRFFLHCHRFADAIVANSHANLDILRTVAPEVPLKKQHVIYNSLNPDKFENKTNFKFAASPRRDLLVASSHRYLKNLDGLIEAVNMLPKQLQDQLIVNWYGHNKFSQQDHSLEDGLQKIEAYGLQDNFAFHDATLDIYTHMRQADGIGLFSQFEGFPNAICEGMFLAKPIVATKVSDIPLLLQEDENAFLSDATSARSIADSLIKFLEASPQQLQQIGQNNRIKAEKLFNRELILNQYEHLFYN